MLVSTRPGVTPTPTSPRPNRTPEPLLERLQRRVDRAVCRRLPRPLKKPPGGCRSPAALMIGAVMPGLRVLDGGRPRLEPRIDAGSRSLRQGEVGGTVLNGPGRGSTGKNGRAPRASIAARYLADPKIEVPVEQHCRRGSAPTRRLPKSRTGSSTATGIWYYNQAGRRYVTSIAAGWGFSCKRAV